MSPVIFAMGVVIAGWALLTLTSANAELRKRDVWRMIALGIWLVIVAAGWAAIAYIAYLTPGGLDGAWQWTLDQPLLLRISMWVFLLPYMGALSIWQSGWAEWQRTAAIVALAAATFLLSFKRR